MTAAAPAVYLDQQTRDELTPPCEASPMLFRETDCPDPAGWVLHINGWGRRLATVLICDQHADASRRHLNGCRECAAIFTFNLEPI